MSKEVISAMLDAVEWKPTGQVAGGSGLYATHEAILRIGAAELRVYQLNDGQRVFDAEDVERFFSTEEE